MRNRIQHEVNRLMRLEGGTVSESGPDGLSVRAPGRTIDRTHVANSLGLSVGVRERLAILAGGDNDLVVPVGVNPWVF